MKKEIVRELERKVRDKKNLLVLCAYGCERIEVKTGDDIYWFAREENPELYDRVLENYKQREKNAIGLEDLSISHGICPDCYKREIEKLGK